MQLPRWIDRDRMESADSGWTSINQTGLAVEMVGMDRQGGFLFLGFLYCCLFAVLSGIYI